MLLVIVAALQMQRSGDNVTSSIDLDVSSLTYQTVIAPVRYENALKAYKGFGEWKPDYDVLKYNPV